MRVLRTTCSALALAVALAWQFPVSFAAERETAETRGLARTSLSIEAMPLFVRNDPTLRFDPTNEKLGNLGALRPGDRGLQGRVALTHALDETWDTRVSASMLYAGKDAAAAPYLSSDNTSTASASARALVADAEAGYRFKPAASVDARLFVGARALRSTGQGDWATSADDKLGQSVGHFDDVTRALGPRVGAELTIPVASRVDLVGAGSVSALNARSRSRYEAPNGLTREHDQRWVFGADAMAGAAFDLGDGARLTLGYRVEYWRNLALAHAEVESGGAQQTHWGAPTLSHGPALRLSLPLGAGSAR